jgi:hypothetical protein
MTGLLLAELFPLSSMQSLLVVVPAFISDINNPVSPATPGLVGCAEVACDGLVAVEGEVDGDGVGDSPKMVGVGSMLGDGEVDGADEGEGD